MAKAPARGKARASSSAPERTVDLFLWQAATLASTPGAFQQQDSGFVQQVRTTLEALEVRLNDPQWEAWQRALTQRLTLIWGPPGTGKSATLRMIVAGFCVAAVQLQRPVRILVGAANYTALDTLLLETATWVQQHTTTPAVSIYRLCSPAHTLATSHPAVVDTIHEPDNPLVTELHRRLAKPQGAILVGAVPDQVYNFVTKRQDEPEEEKKPHLPVAELFDAIVIDEAAQMDVGHSLPFLCAAAAEAQVILAGDPLQLAPIAAVPAPQGAEYLLGSVYTYIKERPPKIPDDTEQRLQINYRSNEEIVSYGRLLGYSADYRSYSPTLRLALGSPLMREQPEDWPEGLAWSPEWATLLDPQIPVVCFQYPEGRSGQSNRFEGQAIASLLWLLWAAQPRQQLQGEVGMTTQNAPTHTPETFWGQCVGVVTPHVAQRALMVSELTRAFEADFQQRRQIRTAVDTVERFQGQQRDVIIASFTVGDPDVIAQEDAFLLLLNRFNVMASRPRAKLIVFVTDEIVDHLSADADVLKNSHAIKLFAGSFCQKLRPATLPWKDQTGIIHSCTGDLLLGPIGRS